jgi:hypothetical protein
MTPHPSFLSRRLSLQFRLVRLVKDNVRDEEEHYQRQNDAREEARDELVFVSLAAKNNRRRGPFRGRHLSLYISLSSVFSI